MKYVGPLFVIPAVAIVALDQVSKHLVIRAIPFLGSIPLVEGFFNLVHIRNRGLAFGLMNRPGSNLSTYLLVAATLFAVGLLIFWFTRLKDKGLTTVLPLSFILGGAVGNLIDRLRMGEVVDFLDFYLGPYHWPAFNVADSAITVGTLWLAIQVLFLYPAKGGEEKG